MTARKTDLSEETARCVHDAAVAYVPRILLETLAAHPSRAIPWREWVEGTLVMADVSGFTAMSERLAKAGKEGAEWLTDIINWYFGRMLDIASGCGGTTLTFGGDAILLLFYGEDHERRAIAASLRMLHATEELPAYRVANHRVKLSMSMGAHAGRFLTASVGTNDHAQYLILGPETVKTAQAEGAASSGELAITAATADRVAASAVLEPLGEFFRVGRLVNTPRYAPVVQKVPGTVPPRMLAAYLPPFVSDVLRSDPEAPAPVVDHEHRNVTVAFVNVLGVDDVLADGDDALLEELQRCVEPVVRLADEHHGYVVSNDIYTNGFKLIVAFGAPAAHEHDAANALRFAVAVREQIADGDLRLTCRIGVNGGFVYAGDVGPPYRRQYTVMGDAVNLAARLMSAAEAGQVLTSTRTAEAAGSGFLLTELAPIKVKGKEHPIPISLVDGECAIVTAPASEGAAFHGRETEMAALDRVRSEVAGGAGRVVLVRGEAGMGKTRLAAELERLVAADGWVVSTGRAHEHTAGEPFAPWIPLLESLLDFGPGDDAAARTGRATEAVQRMAPAFTEWAPLLNPLLGLAIPQTDFVRSLSDTSRRERMFDLVAELLRHRATSSPLLLHLEDAHWADASSLELLQHVARGVRSHRILLFVTERFDGAPELDLPAGATTELDLVQLSGEAAHAVIRETLGRELPDPAVRVLLDKTRGNPLFLQEVARSIARSDWVACVSDERELTRRLSEMDIPDRIQGLLMSSIDSLSPPAKEILRTASVVGTTFDVATLRGSLDGPGDGSLLDERLSDLVCQTLLVRQGGSGGAKRYGFRHALIQEVAYDSLAFAKRRRLHHRVASFLEDSRRGRLEPVYEALVRHYRLSRDLPKTRVFAVRAGEKALRLLAHDEAIDYFRIGLQSVGLRTPAGAVARSYLMEQIGDCYHLTGRHQQAARAYRDALDRCRTSGPAVERSVVREAECLLELREMPSARTWQARLCHKVGVSYTRTHCDYDRSLRWLDRATCALPPQEAGLACRIDATRSVALIWTGRHEESVRVARRAARTARRLGDADLQARAVATLAAAFQELGDLKLSARHRSLALELYREAGDLPGQAEAHNNLAVCLISQGYFDPALHHLQEALKIDEGAADLTGTALTHCNLGEVRVMCGDYDEAIVHLRTVLELCERAGAGPSTPVGFALMMLSRAYACLGRHEEAVERLDESVEMLKRTGATTFLAETRVQRADFLLMAGQLDEALAQCEKGIAEARTAGMKLVEMRGLRFLGRISAARGNVDDAENSLRESEELARRASAPYERGLALLDLAEVRASAGHPYRRVLATAAALLAPTGAAPDVARARVT
jgi:class 3 adenylate cyclase/tetratricopeptide (TPR) repeat protein